MLKGTGVGRDGGIYLSTKDTLNHSKKFGLHKTYTYSRFLLHQARLPFFVKKMHLNQIPGAMKKTQKYNILQNKWLYNR